MTTAADLIAETRTYFLGNLREQKNKLASDVDTDDTAFTFTYPLGSIQAGAVLTVGLERMYVWAVSASTVTVERGWDGTTAAAHTAGDVVSINSRCDDFAIFRALNNELNTLSSPARGLFRVRAANFTYNPSTYGYDLATATFGSIIGSPLAVLAEGSGAGEWTPLLASGWNYNAAADTTDFPSGRSLTLLSGGSSGLNVRLVYRAPFVALTSTATDVNTASFFPSTANDILPMGAALQLASTRPMQRADVGAQGSTRRAEEVSTQDTLIAVSGLRARYEQRIQDEATRLAAEFPQAI